MGEEVLDWLIRIQRCFRVNEIEGEEKMEVVLVALARRKGIVLV